MVVDTTTQESGSSQDPPSKETDKGLAEKTNEGSEAKSPEQILQELMSGIPTAEKSDSKAKKPKEKEDEPSDPPKEDPPEKGELTLENYLTEETPITFKNKSKFPDISEDDIDYSGKAPVIKSQHVYDDMAAIFGSTEKDPDLRVFLKINNAKPKKAEALAKLAGFRSRHHFAMVIEEVIDAKDDEVAKAKIVEKEFPGWAIADSGVEVPFGIDIQKKEEKKAELHGRTFEWTQQELDRSINDYVADNNITKEALLKNAKLFKLLGEYSGLSRGGKVLSAAEVLNIVVPLAGINKTPKKTPKALGGGQKPKQPSASKANNPGLMEFAKTIGLNTQDFQKFLDSKK